MSSPVFKNKIDDIYSKFKEEQDEIIKRELEGSAPFKNVMVQNRLDSHETSDSGDEEEDLDQEPTKQVNERDHDQENIDVFDQWVS